MTLGIHPAKVTGPGGPSCPTRSCCCKKCPFSVCRISVDLTKLNRLDEAADNQDYIFYTIKPFRKEPLPINSSRFYAKAPIFLLSESLLI